MTSSDPEPNTSPPAGPEQGAGFFSSPVGHVFILGNILLVIALVVAAVTRLRWPDYGGAVLSHAASHVLTGRAGGMLAGRSLGISLPVAIVISSVMDMLVVFNLFPLIVYSYRRIVEFRLFGGAMRSAMEVAERQRVRLGKFGLVGVMLFVWFPFHMTGPLIGSLIGFLIGLPVWVNMAVVMVGTILAAISWAFAYEYMARLLQGLHDLSPFALVAVLLALLLFLRVRALTQHSGKQNDPK